MSHGHQNPKSPSPRPFSSAETFRGAHKSIEVDGDNNFDEEYLLLKKPENIHIYETLSVGCRSYLVGIKKQNAWPWLYQGR